MNVEESVGSLREQEASQGSKDEKGEEGRAVLCTSVWQERISHSRGKRDDETRPVFMSRV